MRLTERLKGDHPPRKTVATERSTESTVIGTDVKDSRDVTPTQEHHGPPHRVRLRVPKQVDAESLGQKAYSVLYGRHEDRLARVQYWGYGCPRFGGGWGTISTQLWRASTVCRQDPWRPTGAAASCPKLIRSYSHPHELQPTTLRSGANSIESHPTRSHWVRCRCVDHVRPKRRCRETASAVRSQRRHGALRRVLRVSRRSDSGKRWQLRMGNTVRSPGRHPDDFVDGALSVALFRVWVQTAPQSLASQESPRSRLGSCY